MIGQGRVIRAVFSINTPMFLGGADPKGEAGRTQPLRIRETSLRGAIAYWWRSLS